MKFKHILRLKNINQADAPQGDSQQSLIRRSETPRYEDPHRPHYQEVRKRKEEHYISDSDESPSIADSQEGRAWI